MFHDSPVRNMIELKVHVPRSAGGGGSGGNAESNAESKGVLTDYSPLFPLTPGDKVSTDMLDALNVTWPEFRHLLWDPVLPMAAGGGWPHGIAEGGMSHGAAAACAGKLGAAIRRATRACEVNWWDDWG